MRLIIRSILSPGRRGKSTARAAATSSYLSASLSRRIRAKNASLKGDGGGQSSPMFSAASGKKRGSGFDQSQEPSSPKVTCIGQVRVKTKKRSKKTMMTCRSRRHGGEMSFRKVGINSHESFSHHQGGQLSMHQDCLPHRNQRWVHLPLTICEALRAFGAEINCFMPCKSPCIARDGERGKVEMKGMMGSSGRIAQGRENSNPNNGSCGGAICRWFVSLHEGEVKRRDIELVVGGDEEEGEMGTERGRGQICRRRSIFDGIEFKNEICGLRDGDGDEPRVSICIPPKNALLLMRCRSDPVRMTALSKKFWEPTIPNEEDEEDDEVFEGAKGYEAKRARDGSDKMEEEIDVVDQCERHVIVEDGAVESAPQERKLPEEGEGEEELEWTECRDSPLEEESKREDEDAKVRRLIEVEIISIGCPIHHPISGNPEKQLGGYDDDDKANVSNSIEGATNGAEVNIESSSWNANSERNNQEHREGNPVESGGAILDQELCSQESRSVYRGSQKTPTIPQMKPKECQTTHESRTPEDSRIEGRERDGHHSEEEQEGEAKPARQQGEHQERKTETAVLPECLLLMMCEPKLSMEVSKETWVCSRDFLRWVPDRHHNHRRSKFKPMDNKKKKKDTSSTDTHNPPLPSTAQRPVFQPPRSSCSFPVVMEKKAVSAAPNEPIELTRCKSEPVRSSAKFVAAPAPDLASFWMKRKLEPHRPAAFGVGC